MNSRKPYVISAVALLVLPLLIAAGKFSQKATTPADFLPREVFEVIFEFDLSNLSKEAFVKTYLPVSTSRQTIRQCTLAGDSLSFSTSSTETGKRGRWETDDQLDAIFSYQFEIEGKAIRYSIPPQAILTTTWPDTVAPFLQSTVNIQSEHPMIDSLATVLKSPHLLATVRANFDFVSRITNSDTGVLTDAVTALRRYRASCNGKSRLFVALCRAQGIPARVVGGIILENARKRTSHLWAEIYYEGHWIPFDILNHHFAALPANYLELYKGDNFLITHSKDIGFDYQFNIQKKYRSFESVASSGFQLWPLLSDSTISLLWLSGIILLPLAALVIAIFKNVIGLKTFGIFLPVLIGLSLSKLDLSTGIMIFGIVIMIVSLLHVLLEKWGLLHIPKVVIMLTCVVITLLGLGLWGVHQDWETLSTALFLPVVVLSITAERFAKTLVEEHIGEALKILGNTFLIALLCIPLFRSTLLVGFFLTYPEFYLSILGLMLLLGRWIGMRVLEYRRFSAFAS